MNAPFYLAAMPKLDDPLFLRSVVLITKQSSEGAFGLVINKPLINEEEEELTQMVAEIKDPEGNTVNEFHEGLFHGGPTDEQTIFALHDVEELGDEKNYIAPGLYLATQADVFQMLLEKEDYKERRRFFLGSSSWYEGQLEAELRGGAWITVPFNKKYVFSDRPEDSDEEWEDQLWSSLLKSSGVNPLTLMGQSDDEDVGYN